MSILEVSNLKKIYTTRFGASQVQALSNISFSVEEGEYVAIMGESGSGKTTLLNILAALDQPTDGEVILNGKNCNPSGKRRSLHSDGSILDLCFRILICLTILTSATIFICRLSFRIQSMRKWRRGWSLLQRSLVSASFWISFRMKYRADRSSVWQWQEPLLQDRS